MPKTSKVEYDKRIMAIEGWIIDDVPSKVIKKQILHLQWGDWRQAERMIAKAWEELKPKDKQKIEEKKELKLKQLQHLKKSLKPEYKGTPDGIRAIVAIEKEIIKIDGLTSPIKLEHTGSDGKPIQVESISNIDYTKLPTDVLKAIINARIKTAS